MASEIYAASLRGGLSPTRKSSLFNAVRSLDNLVRQAILAMTVAFFSACASLPALAQGVNPAAVIGLEGQHPAEYFKRAKELFEAGRRDDSVFAFYLGQLRYRRHLAARPDLPKDKDAALFAALMATLGPPINQYAFGDIPRLARCIDAVLAHDRRSPDQATPQALFPKAHASVRAGLAKLKTEILKRRESIRADRVKNGLTNRT